jgi:hypothetical protein
MPISHVELHAPGSIELAPLERAFPAIGFVRTARARAGAIDGAAWRSESFDFWAFDRTLDDLAERGAPLAITAERDIVGIALEIVTRAQRVMPRRNEASKTTWFARVLDMHAHLHDLSKPLVRADFDHALDAWQWTLRLDGAAPADVQLGALCHDLERLASEADARIEHTAPDYQHFKNAHATGSAWRAAVLFARAGVPGPIARLAELGIANHEHAISPIADADALSFFSFNSFGYLRYFGVAQTAFKVGYTYKRLSSRARRELPALRLPAVVAMQLANLRRST